MLIGIGAGLLVAFSGNAGFADAGDSRPNMLALLALTSLVPTLACWWLAVRLVTGFRRSEARLGF